MHSNETLNQITQHHWRNKETNEICSFIWSEEKNALLIEFQTGPRAGKRDIHRLVKLYGPKTGAEGNIILQFQSNLFKTTFSLQYQKGILLINSDVFGNMELEKTERPIR